MKIKELVESLLESFPDFNPVYVLESSGIVKGIHGIYVVYNADAILYIGKAGGLKNSTEHIKGDISKRVNSHHDALRTRNHKIKDLLIGGCENRNGKLMYVDTWSKGYSPTYIEHFLLQQYYSKGKSKGIPEFNNSF